MRRTILFAPLLLAACNNAGNWENQQAQLANELNPTTATEEANVEATAANDVNAVEPAATDVNAVDTNTAENEATPQG